MAMVGGDPDAIQHGGELLRDCARAEESFRAGFEAVRSSGVAGCGPAGGGGAEIVARWAAAHDALAEDLGRELSALAVLASSTAADLAAASAVDAVAGFGARIDHGLRGAS